MSTRPLHFSAFIWPNGYHEVRVAGVDDDVRGVLGLSYYADIARIAERGLMDCDLPGRQHRHRRIPHHVPAADAIRPDLGALGAGRGHQPHRADRDGLDDLQQAVGAGPPVCDAGSSQRRPGRLEHRHHRHAAGRGELRRAAAILTMPTATRALTNSSRSSRARGTAGRTTRSSVTANAACGQTAASCTRRASTASTTTSKGSCRFPARRKGTRCSFRQDSRHAGVGLAARYAELVFSGPPSLEAAVPSGPICTPRSPPQAVTPSRCWSCPR